MLPASAHTRLETQYQSILWLLDDLDWKYVTRRPANNKWSVLENVAHLVRYQEVFLERVDRILHEANPNFGGYAAEADDNFHQWTQQSISELVQHLAGTRRVIIEKLNSLSADGWSRKGFHPKAGLIPVAMWVEFFLLHEAHHLFTIFWLVCDWKREIEQLQHPVHPHHNGK